MVMVTIRPSTKPGGGGGGLHAAFSSSGALGWKMLRARTNSSKSMTSIALDVEDIKHLQAG